ncbi:MAG: polysaccharide deacetylase family protein [Clostridia bacterium]|nr:polysaccharide deacetylase family protein [Clostridia bacterium]
MTMNERQKILAAKRKRAAYLKKKKQQKRMLIILACVLFALAVAVILIFALTGSDKENPAASSLPETTMTPEASPTPLPSYLSYLNIHSSSPKFESALPVYHTPNVTGKMIAITIDDCNEDWNVQKIIDLAVSNNAKLTFFPIGNQLTSKDLRQALKNAYAAGFEIENHTVNHIYQEKLTDEEFFNEVLNQETAVRSALGVDYKMNFLRLPGGNGEEDPRVHHYLKKLGYKAIADWYYSGTDADIYYIKKRLTPGAIYLFHTTNEDYQKLKEFIPYAVSQGYQLVTLNELVGYAENAVYPAGTIENPVFSEYVYSEYIVMKKGMRATCIKHLQSRLIELNYLPADAVADGIFGSQTEEAVKRFQSAHNLEATGAADLSMQAILFSDAAKHAGF